MCISLHKNIEKVTPVKCDMDISDPLKAIAILTLEATTNGSITFQRARQSNSLMKPQDHLLYVSFVMGSASRR